jgi:hypothetical protein
MLGTLGNKWNPYTRIEAPSSRNEVEREVGGGVPGHPASPLEPAQPRRGVHADSDVRDLRC